MEHSKVIQNLIEYLVDSFLISDITLVRFDLTTSLFCEVGCELGC